MAQAATAVSFEEYLATSYRPDVEYIDGQLKAKPVVRPVHGRTQVLLGSWFFDHEDEWGVQTVVETRTQVRVEQIRLPDVAILAAGPLPEKALVDPPLIAIEVLSDTDSYKDLKMRALDLETMGVKNIWLIDPKGKTAEVWSRGAWVLFPDLHLRAVDSPAYLDLGWLWDKLEKSAGV